MQDTMATAAIQADVSCRLSLASNEARTILAAVGNRKQYVLGTSSQPGLEATSMHGREYKFFLAIALSHKSMLNYLP